jgi:hypothetical protein
MMKQAAAAILCLTLFGCAGTQLRWEKARVVREGMSEAELAMLLGPPNLVRSNPDGQVWVWSHVNLFTGEIRTLTVPLQSGKVSKAPEIPAFFTD